MSDHALPAVSDLRALEQFDTIPAGHTGMVVTSDRFAPHLRPGEIAVVNPGDKEPVSGELFVIGITDRYGARVPRIVQTFGRMEDVYKNGEWITELGWYDRFQFKRGNELILSDGPMYTEGWRDHRCVGRIVGFVAPEWELAGNVGGDWRLERRA